MQLAAEYEWHGGFRLVRSTPPACPPPPALEDSRTKGIEDKIAQELWNEEVRGKNKKTRYIEGSVFTVH